MALNNPTELVAFNLQQVSDNGNNSTIQLQFNGTNYVTEDEIGNYLPLLGGEMQGNITFNYSYDIIGVNNIDGGSGQFQMLQANQIRTYDIRTTMGDQAMIIDFNVVTHNTLTEYQNDGNTIFGIPAYTEFSLVPKQYVDSVANSVNTIYTSDGVINSTRLVDMVDVITTFRANGVLDGFISDIKFNSFDGNTSYGGTISIGLGLGLSTPGEYQSVLNLVGDEGAIYFKPSNGVLRENTVILTNGGSSFTSYNTNATESVIFSISGHGGAQPGVQLFDYRTTKTSIQISNYGETDNIGTGADYSSLLFNSLVPKLYVDDLVSTIGQSFSEQTHTTGDTVTITDTTTILYVDPTSTLASLTITLPANPVNGQEVKVSFGGSLLSGVVVTLLTIVGNTGHSLLSNASITTANAGDGYIFKFQSSTNTWRVF